MGIGTILTGLALLIIVVVVVISPLLEQRRPAVTPASPREALEEEHETTLRAIREIDLDYRTHKLNEEDYKTLRVKQVARGAQILREMDALKGELEIDAEIEAQVAAIREAQGRCPACGRPVKEDDHFCAHCGAQIHSREGKE
jgi:DNA repair exonuclease SbcCD ATPase subunit